MQKILALCLVLCSPVFALDFSRYHTQDEINGYLQQLAQDNPPLVHFYNLGESDEKRPINYITLTKGNEKLPALFFNGTHHGDEWSSTESILGLTDYLITHKEDPKISALLTKYVFYLEPLVNPDGHFRKTREDVNGNDPNRDYSYPGETGTGFQTKIISLMKKLLDSRKFHAAAAYHSGIQEVLWSWCYTNTPTDQNNVLYTMGKNSATAMGFDRYLQSYDDYETEGEFIDYAFMTQGTFALTFEVSDAKTPPESDLASIVSNSILGAMSFAQSVSDYDAGTLNIEQAPTYSLVNNHNILWDMLGRKLE